MATPRVEHAPIVCGAPDCEVEFTPKHARAQYHSATCQRRASRARKAAERQAEEAAKAGTDAEHGLVKAVRAQLETAGKLDTVNGQLALELARRAVTPESSLVSISKELDARLTAALGASAAEPRAAEPEPAEPDDVTKAREARDRKRAAAGQA